MKRIVMVVLMALVLASGCESTVEKKKSEALAAVQALKKEEDNRRQHYLEANPDLSPAVRTAIAHGDVLPAMTENDVRASIGEPDEIATTLTDHGVREQWYYKTGPPGKEHLNLEDGTLTGWQPDQ